MSRYCGVVEVDPYHTLKMSIVGRFKNFLHWMCNEYSVKKVSSVETYWHNLSQLYIEWKGCRMNPVHQREIYAVREPSLLGTGGH